MLKTLIQLSWLVFALTIPQVKAAELPQAITGVIDQFTKQMDQGAYDKLFATVYRYNPWVDEEVYAEASQETSDSFQNLGRYYGYENLGQANVQDRLIYTSLFLKFERQPVVAEFIFYKANKRWILRSFAWNDEIEQIIEDYGRQKNFTQSLVK